MLGLLWLMVEGLGGVIPALLVLTLVIALPTTLGLFVLGPISREAGRLQAPTRFMLSDILWLLVHFQIVLWYCVEHIGTAQISFFLVALGTLSMAILLTWCGAISFASRAGVTQPRRRVTFVLVHLPATLMLMIVASCAVVTVVLLQTNWATHDFRAQLQFLVALLNLTPELMVVLMALIPLGAWALRRLAHWILHRAPTGADLSVSQTPSF